MKRRGNKSHKVPGVKLRPAQEGALKLQAAREDLWADDSQLASDDTAISDLCPRPFRGVVLCATGIQDKTTMFKRAIELGAQTMNAFTDRVTHLIADDHGGAKYACAVQRKIPIMKASWIKDSYHTWLKGDDVNFAESIAEYRLPIFTGVVLCLSGIGDLERKKDIARLVAKHGGQFLRNLERPVRVTHLLCSGDAETEKMRYAEKFNKSGEAHIFLVWEEWFWDAIDFHGRFDETTYQVRDPRPERKQNPEDSPTSPPPPSLTSTKPEQRPLSAKESQSASAPPQGDEEDEEVVANIKKLPAVTLHLWSSLLKVRGYEVQDGRLLLSPTKDKPTKELPVEDPIPFKPNGSILSTFRRTSSFAQPETKDAGLSTARQPFRRAITTQTLSMRNPPHPELHISAEPNQNPEAGFSRPPTQQLNAQVDQQDHHPNTLFRGKRFWALGEAKSQSVRDAILRKGGVFVSDADVDDDLVDYIIVRLVSGSKLFREEPDEALRPKYRTECWLERCIFEDRICPPEGHITSLPLNVSLPVAGADAVNLTLSGFDQSEGFWVTRLLRALGINLEKSFSPKSTHLLCPSGTGIKFDKAKEWNIPIINMDWLIDIARTGTIPVLEDKYVVDSACGGVSRLPPGGENARTNDVKGKGKAIEPWGPLKNKVSTKKQSAGQIPLVNNITNSDNDVHDTQTQPIPIRIIPMQKTNSTSSTTSNASSSSSRTASSRSPSPVKMIFGPPSDILAQPSLSHELSTSSLVPNVHRTPTRSGGRLLNMLGTTTHPNTPKRTQTAQSRIEQTEPSNANPDDNCIPSSRTPSPMKTPRMANGRTRPMSASPTKPVIDLEAARALQESITSMLGKRASEEEAGAHATGGRAGKRPRPQRSRGNPKDLAHQLSSISTIPTSEFTTGGGGLFESIEDVTISSFRDKEGWPFAAVEERNVGDENVRVVYEDPGQMDERKRLMSLLQTQVEEDGQRQHQAQEAGNGEAQAQSSRRAGSAAPSVGTRRSTRVAGF